MRSRVSCEGVPGIDTVMFELPIDVISDSATPEASMRLRMMLIACVMSFSVISRWPSAVALGVRISWVPPCRSSARSGTYETPLVTCPITSAAPAATIATSSTTSERTGRRFLVATVVLSRACSASSVLVVRLVGGPGRGAGVLRPVGLVGRGLQAQHGLVLLGGSPPISPIIWRSQYISCPSVVSRTTISPSRSTKRPQKPTRVWTQAPGVTVRSCSRFSSSIFAICCLRERPEYHMTPTASTSMAMSRRFWSTSVLFRCGGACEKHTPAQSSA